MELLQKKIGAEIKRLRIAAGFSSYELFADKAKLSRIQYFKMEKGTNCTLKSLHKILRIHSISIISFFHSLSVDVEKEKEITEENRLNSAARISALLKHLNVTKLEFSSKLGFANNNQLNAILRKRNSISPQLAFKINEVYPQISFMWLVKGDGEMLVK